MARPGRGGWSGRRGNRECLQLPAYAFSKIESVESQIAFYQIYRGENEIQASLINSASTGATPVPATIFREVIRPLDCRSSVTKYVSEATNWSVTSTSHHFDFEFRFWIFDLGGKDFARRVGSPDRAPVAEQKSDPLSAGRVWVQVPPGAPISFSNFDFGFSIWKAKILTPSVGTPNS